MPRSLHYKVGKCKSFKHAEKNTKNNNKYPLKCNFCSFLAIFDLEIALLFIVLQFYSLCMYSQTLQNIDLRLKSKWYYTAHTVLQTFFFLKNVLHLFMNFNFWILFHCLNILVPQFTYSSFCSAAFRMFPVFWVIHNAAMNSAMHASLMYT